jgi:hypothetical protein
VSREYRCAIHADAVVAVGGRVDEPPRFRCMECDRNAQILDGMRGPLMQVTLALRMLVEILPPSPAVATLTGVVPPGKATPPDGWSAPRDGVSGAEPICDGCGHERHWHTRFGCQRLDCMCAARTEHVIPE